MKILTPLVFIPTDVNSIIHSIKQLCQSYNELLITF